MARITIFDSMGEHALFAGEANSIEYAHQLARVYSFTHADNDDVDAIALKFRHISSVIYNAESSEEEARTALSEAVFELIWDLSDHRPNTFTPPDDDD